MNHYEILGIAADSTSKQVQDAYLLSVSTYGEESIASYIVISDEEKKKMLTRVEMAYRTLSNQVKRTIYNEEVLKVPAPNEEPSNFPSSLETQPAAKLISPPKEESPKSPAGSSFLGFKWPFGKKRSAPRETIEQQQEPTINVDGQIDLSGAYLKNVREVKSITIEEVSKKTRIKMSFLQAIEEDNQSEFPEKIFLNGFIKTYTKYLGLDPEQFIKNYKYR